MFFWLPARRLKATFWLLAIVLGLSQAWVSRHLMKPDGISYLDMGDAYFRGDWNMAINAYWSPLYAWLLGLAMRLLRPSAYWEFTVVHLVNFIIYLCALASFDFFLRQLIRCQRINVGAAKESMALPTWAWLVLGYSLFIWSSLILISVKEEGPDMCVAAFVYLACAIVLRIRMGELSWLTFGALGAVLAFGYFAKEVMFPLTLVFLAVSVFVVGDLRKALPRVLVATAVFLLVAGPFIVALSRAEGRLTFGNSGRLNYAMAVNGTAPIHRKIFAAPTIYGFRTEVGGTNPEWYDPAQSEQRVAPYFDVNRQMKTIVANAKTYKDILFSPQGSLILTLFILFYLTALYDMEHRGWLMAKNLSAYWFLLVPAIAALGMYLLVNVQTRYVAPFAVLLCVGLLSCVRLPDSRESKRLVVCATVTALTMFLISIGPTTFRTFRDLIVWRNSSLNRHWYVADGLKRMGVQQGDKVASIGDARTAYWARLARVRIVAEVPSEDTSEFWTADSLVKDRIFRTLVESKSDLIVASEVPKWAPTDGWQRIGNTNSYVYFLLK
jgi:hypothetical protein